MAEASELKFEIRNGYAIIIDNKTFTPESGLLKRSGSERGKYNMKEFCREAGLHLPQRTDNLTLAETRDLFEAISRKDFTVTENTTESDTGYDAFVAFVSSYGIQGELYTKDGKKITIREIVSKVEENPSLEGKPKLFFFNNCLDKETVLPDNESENPPSPVEPLYVPMSCDVLIGYASVDGYENPRSKKHGSWGARVLKKVLEEHAFDMSLTELLAIVVRKDNEFSNPESERKQVSCYISTLTRPVRFIRQSQSPLS